GEHPARRDDPEVLRPGELPDEREHEQATGDDGYREHEGEHGGEVGSRPPARKRWLRLAHGRQRNASACAAAQSANVRAGRPVTSATVGYTVASSRVPPT